MKERAMFHLKVKVFENGNLIRDFSTPRRFDDAMWAEKYFRYLEFLANKWYPIFKRWCVGEDVLPKDNIGTTASWFIYHCKLVWMKRALSPEEVITIYEMCRAHYYSTSSNPNTTEVTVYYEMSKENTKIEVENMSKLSIMIQFNREITDKDLACIGLGGIYLKTNNSYIGLDYMDVEKTKEGKNLILFRLKNDNIDTFPDMVKLQDILKEDGLIVDELNIEYDPTDILPIYPIQIYFSCLPLILIQ